MTDDNASEKPAPKNPGTPDQSSQSGTDEPVNPPSSEEADTTDSAEDWQDPNEEESGSSGCLKVVAGCAGASFLLVFVIAIVVYFSWGYLTNMLTNQATNMVKSSIEESELSKEQKKKLKKRVDQIKTRFNNNEISIDQVRTVAEKTQPLLLASTVQAVKQAHIPQTDWSEQEKKDANRVLDRFMQGLSEQKISNQEFNTVIEPVLASDNENTTKLEKNPSDKKLKNFVQRARKHADKHNIPDEPYNFDAISRFDEIIKNTLSENGTGQSEK